MITNSLLSEVLEYHGYGFSMIPSGGGASGKAPLIAWTEYQKRLPTIEELKEWENKYHPHLWGVVTGAVSRIFVIDCDTPISTGILEAAGLSPQLRTPRGGSHFYFKYPGYPVKTVAGILPGVDCRGDGGFVNLFGGRPDGDYTFLIPLTQNTDFYIFKQLPVAIRGAITEAPQNNLPSITIPPNNSPELSSRLLKKALTEVGNGNGNRNTTGFWLACQLRDSGLSQLDSEPFMMQYAGNVYNLGKPPYEIEEALASLESAFSRNARSPIPPLEPPGYTGNNVYVANAPGAASEPNKNLTDNLTKPNTAPNIPLAERIEEWVKNTRGWFTTDELDRELGIRDLADKNNRMVVMGRLANKAGIVVRHPRENKIWRFVDIKRTDILYKTASASGIIPVKWPLEVETKVNLLPGNIAVIAGVSGTGKTAWGLNFIKLNQDKFHIHLFCSEMDEKGVQLKERLELFEGIDLSEWTFEAHYQTEHFEDVIEPDCVNIIDYLEMTQDLFNVNTHLTAISHKIGSGLAIVFIQKKMGAALGYGAEFSLFKAALYINLDLNKATIIKGRSWANKLHNPAGLYREFRIFNGADFRTEKDWQRGD